MHEGNRIGGGDAGNLPQFDPLGLFDHATAKAYFEALTEVPQRQVAVQRAVDLLLQAGMVFRFRSAFGYSWYLGWPGRQGTLRVSDHQSHRRQDAGIYARVTFSDTNAMMPDDGIADRCAVALGRYLMRAPRKGGHDS